MPRWLVSPAVLAMSLAASSAYAQSQPVTVPPTSWPVTMLPFQPLPEIGLPLPHIGLPPQQPVTRPPDAPQAPGGHVPQQPTVVFIPYVIANLPPPAAVPREGVAKPSTREREVEPAPAEKASLAPEPEAAPLPPGPPVSPAAVYVIPGCYAGNVPPVQVQLPAGCDASRAVKLPK